jgi:DNA invertase Pin-like site-specific DNA recombinase
MNTDESLFSCDRIAREVVVDVILCDYVGVPATERALLKELLMNTEKQPSQKIGLIVGYVRVSTERQASEGQSIEAQEERIRAYAKASGLTVDRIYKDNGASGKDVNRPSIARLMSGLDEIGVVIDYKFDRISRSVVDLYTLLERFQEAGVAFKSVSEGVDTGSAIGRFIMSVLASLAQMERELIGERTRDTLAHKKVKGEHCGRVPFGCRVGQDGRLEKDPDQQKVIAKIKRLRRNGRSEVT